MKTSLQLLLALVPLVVFYVVESTWGLEAGVVLAMVFVLGEVAWTRWRTQKWSKLSLGIAVMVLGLGGLSLLSEDERFFLFTPVVGDVVLAAVLFGSVALGRSVLVIAAQQQDPTVESSGAEARYLDRLTMRVAVNFLLHAIVTAWAASQPRETWLFVSGPLQYLMLGGQVAGELAWASWGPREEPVGAEDEPGTE